MIADPHMNTELEGCLSLPGAYIPVSRPAVAIVRGQDQFGDHIKFSGRGDPCSVPST